MKLKPLLVVLVLAPLALTGCRDHSRDDIAPPIDHSVKDVKITAQYRGIGKLLNGRPGLQDAKPTIYWLNQSGKGVALTTYGSGSCPRVPEQIRVVSPTHVKLTLKDYSGACTADLGPYTTEFILPNQVSRKQSVLFTLQTSRINGSAERVVLQPVYATLATPVA